jgi:hypothetical protein
MPWIDKPNQISPDCLNLLLYLDIYNLKSEKTISGSK